MMAQTMLAMLFNMQGLTVKLKAHAHIYNNVQWFYRSLIPEARVYVFRHL